MKTIRTQTLFASFAIAGLAALLLSLGPGSASVSASGRSGRFHITKECSQYTGGAGSFCTITSSTLSGDSCRLEGPLRPGGGHSGQACWTATSFSTPATRNRAVGRCTLDGVTSLGICTFSDGTGELTGFTARVDVSPFPNDLVNYHWRGTYSFNESGREHGDR